MTSRNVNFKVPAEALQQLDDLAKKKYLPRATMLKRWIGERYERETGKRLRLD